MLLCLRCAGMVAKDFNMTKVLRKRAHIIGSTLRNRTDAFKAELVKELKSQFKEQLRHGDLKPVVDKVSHISKGCFAHMHAPAVVDVTHQFDDDPSPRWLEQM